VTNKTLPSLLALLLVVSCGGPRLADPVILALGDQTVRKSDFDRHVATLESRGGVAVSPEVRRALFDSFLEERVQVLEARSRGLVDAQAGPDEERRAVERLLADVSRVEVTDEEVARYYGEHAEEFKKPESVTVRQILVATLNEARDVRRRLVKEPKAFEALAHSLSRGPEAPGGGLMGTFSRGQLPPELEAAAFALAVGGTSEIVETPLGFHVLRVEAREPERGTSLAEAQGAIRQILSRQKSDRKVREFVSDLLARAKVNHAAADSPPRPS
jgi:parvulin-like peptidyl-prolyl isomerase